MKRKPWEATISVWGQGRKWWWRVYRSFDPRIVVEWSEPCKTKALAYEEARRILTRLGLVEVKT